MDSATLMKRPLFQSTLRRTERQVPCSTMSIHSYFNPRSDERSDGDLLVIDAFVNEFQSTLRRTERPVWHPAPPSCLIFQSTLRRTERPLCFLNLLVQILFQSTLRRTERPIVSGYAKKLGIFQSTLRRTERPILIKFVVFP